MFPPDPSLTVSRLPCLFLRRRSDYSARTALIFVDAALCDSTNMHYLHSRVQPSSVKFFPSKSRYSVAPGARGLFSNMRRINYESMDRAERVLNGNTDD